MFLANPWFLASAIFGLIGLLQEIPSAAKPISGALPAPQKEKSKASPVTVDIGASGVKSKGKKPEADPPAKVLNEPPKDG